MKLWLISRGGRCDYDEYDSAIVAAETENDARHTRPYKKGNFRTWIPAKKVIIEYLGKAKNGTKAGVICASFNAG